VSIGVNLVHEWSLLKGNCVSRLAHLCHGAATRDPHASGQERKLSALPVSALVATGKVYIPGNDFARGGATKGIQLPKSRIFLLPGRRFLLPALCTLD
jgi:hypothetical protein